ncbi:MAG: UDP-2,3-diacylglucosamine diphosphatase LpxI [Thermodesulfovibrionales bacterium]
MKKLGLIAGSGELPFAVAAEARSRGYTVIAVGLDSITDPSLASVVDEVLWVNIGKLGALIDTLKKAGITEAVFAGKVHKSVIYKGKVIPDMRLVRMLFGLKDRSDDSIMLAITGELEGEGIRLLNTTDFTTSLMAPEAVLTKKKPSEDDYRDIAFGWKIAKEIGRLDIGQTVVVKNQAVMAIEAIEGTDEAVRRGGSLAVEGAVVIKISKPQQDMRFDVPVVGTETLRSMAAVKAKVLAIEAEKSILLNRDQFIQEANRHGIIVVGYREP